MEIKAARALLEFLQRVPLRGEEVDAFIYVREQLRQLTEPTPKIIDSAKPNEEKQVAKIDEDEAELLNERDDESIPSIANWINTK